MQSFWISKREIIIWIQQFIFLFHLHSMNLNYGAFNADSGTLQLECVCVCSIWRHLFLFIWLFNTCPRPCWIVNNTTLLFRIRKRASSTQIDASKNINQGEIHKLANMFASSFGILCEWNKTQRKFRIHSNNSRYVHVHGCNRINKLCFCLRATHTSLSSSLLLSKVEASVLKCAHCIPIHSFNF